MNNADRATLAREITIAVEVTQGTISPLALAAMVEDLVVYPLDAAVSAIRQARREVSRITLGEIIKRVIVSDSHPAPDEAFACVPVEEGATVVWTDEIAQAYEAASPLIKRGDLIAGRMAFKDAYVRIVDVARRSRLPARWRVSLGHEASHREAPIARAVQIGRISVDEARALLPNPMSGELQRALALPAPDPVKVEEIRRRIAGIRKVIARRAVA